MIGGHSLGGSMASNFPYHNPDEISGLVLMGSYPPASNDFSLKDMKAFSIYGTKDKIIHEENYEQTKQLLPADTAFIILEGANHSQFGDYGFQKNDGQADILKNIQHVLVVENIINLLHSIE